MCIFITQSCLLHFIIEHTLPLLCSFFLFLFFWFALLFAFLYDSYSQCRVTLERFLFGASTAVPLLHLGSTTLFTHSLTGTLSASTMARDFAFLTNAFHSCILVLGWLSTIISFETDLNRQFNPRPSSYTLLLETFFFFFLVFGLCCCARRAKWQFPWTGTQVRFKQKPKLVVALQMLSVHSRIFFLHSNGFMDPV